MTSRTPKISLKELRQLIQNELNEAKEQPAHVAKAAVSGAAGDLMDAIDKFKEKATPAAMGAVTPLLDELRKILDHINDAPGAYIAKSKPEPKKVSLKPVKSAE